MKKIFLSIISIYIFLVLCACNNAKDNNKTNSNNLTSGTNVILEDVEIHTEPQNFKIADNNATQIGDVVFENDFIKLTFAGFTCDNVEQKLDTLKVRFLAENKTEYELSIESAYETIDAFETLSAQFYHKLAAKETKEVSLTYGSDCVSNNGFKSLEEITELGFIFVCWNSDRTIRFEQKISLYPTARRDYAIVGHELVETDRVIVDNDELFVVFKGYSISDGEIECDFYGHNKSDKEISFHLYPAYIGTKMEGCIPIVDKISAGKETNFQFYFWCTQEEIDAAEFFSFHFTSFEKGDLSGEIIVELDNTSK
ncbi:MAG: hypothetical protein E7314_02135 [Clostridiales bacterium]|nr:hypothetical protein [Clostridiales bacterium]